MLIVITREKYHKENFIADVHATLIQFFLTHINSQISKESVTRPSYYEDCLSNIVHHQTSRRKLLRESRKPLEAIDTYKDTLRNIGFIKERISLNQEMELLNAFRETSEVPMEEDERATISEWEHFTSFYWPYIKQFPEWSYSFAVNHPNHSVIAMDTSKLSLIHI